MIDFQKQQFQPCRWCMPVIPALKWQAVESLSLQPAWSTTDLVPGQPGLYRETLSKKIPQEKQSNTNKEFCFLTKCQAQGNSSSLQLMIEIKQPQENKQKHKGITVEHYYQSAHFHHWQSRGKNRQIKTDFIDNPISNHRGNGSFYVYRKGN